MQYYVLKLKLYTLCSETQTSNQFAASSKGEV